MKQRTMVWHIEGRLCVVVHSAEAPTDAEWEAYLAAAREAPRVRELRVLIRSMGGGPSSLQRQQLQRQVGKHPPPVAVLAPSAGPMRGISTALKWFNGQVGVFDENQLSAACEHLGLTSFEQVAARACLSRLQRRLEKDAAALG